MGALLYFGSWITGLVFLGLKLAGAITWPWLVVFTPVILAGGWTLIVLGLFLLAMLVAAVGVSAASKQMDRDRDKFFRDFGGRGYGPRRL